MKVKIDLKAFKNITAMYEQLMNIDEIPDSLRIEFLQQADNVLRQCRRIITSTEMREALNKKENEEQRRARFDSQSSFKQ